MICHRKYNFVRGSWTTKYILRRTKAIVNVFFRWLKVVVNTWFSVVEVQIFRPWFYWLTHKIPTWAHTLFKTHINISHIYYPNILHIIGPLQILHTQAHKLPWALSQILPIISHISSKFSTKYAYHVTTKIGSQITLFPHKAQHHLACGQNSKKAQNPKVPLWCG